MKKRIGLLYQFENMKLYQMNEKIITQRTPGETMLLTVSFRDYHAESAGVPQRFIHVKSFLLSDLNVLYVKLYS